MSVGLGYVLCLTFTLVCVLTVMGWVKGHLKEMDRVREIQRRDILNDLNSLGEYLQRIGHRLTKLEEFQRLTGRQHKALCEIFEQPTPSPASPRTDS